MSTLTSAEMARIEANNIKIMFRVNCYNKKNENIIKMKAKMQKLSEVTNKEDFFNLPIFDVYREVSKMEIDKLSGKNEANLAPKCPSCGSDRFYVDLQRRSGDEERNFEIHCPSCGKIQRDK